MTVIDNPFSLEGKLVLVTGASSGIGRQCAILCSRMGATVVLFGRDQGRLNETIQFLREPHKHLIYSIDLLEYSKIEGIIKEIVTQKDRIDGLVNCVGISTTLPFNAISPQKIEQYFQTNVIGSLNLTKHTLRLGHFSQAGGSIIFISSVMGVAGENGKTLYSMTKGALVASVKSMAIEMAPRKIRVNAISPGVVETPMSKGAAYSKDEESLNRVKGLHPLGLGSPDDVANACVYLLSEAGRWVTGTNLIVDGGYLAR